MTQRNKSKTLPKELPLCPGPKLNLFRHHDSPIEWIERLGDYGGTPIEGYVFRARIENREYAIKVFRFFDPTEDPMLYSYLLADPTLDNIVHSDDPFYCECKAYGRINELIKKKKSPSLSNVVTPCHGFLFLSDRNTRNLEKKFLVKLGLDEINLEYQESTVGGLMPRAIVKDLAPDPYDYWDGRMLNTMLRGVLNLNRHGIYNRDIKENNYVGTQLVDFGRAWTLPNLIYDNFPDREKEEEVLIDVIRFKEMVQELFEYNYITAEDLRAVRHPMTRRSDVDSIPGELLKLLEDSQDDQDDRDN
ncbi:unnamed protein product [Clonostachys rhizophaga]|uniref:Protein kinase domain-containing protein n=1 Tax=Clonostachys rhizophaga TaxID=160324 RepID=A0A9N9VKM5_9HYPO|nr:unnamed protein product [Clonostachys rhizophaga]